MSKLPTNPTDKRLIEEYIPIKAISAEASREKSIRHGHISTLHLWWARRPLVAARAAVFAALVPADAQPQIIDVDTKQPMTITKFMIELCKWKLSDEVLNEARRLIREAYPDNPPKVLDMFAGGGSIPLEALRLGAEAYALDLNPVAHIIELATLVYPQKYGKQLADDVRKWGEWVLERVRAEVGDLYPLIPDPEHTEERERFFKSMPKQDRLFPTDEPEQLTLDDAVTVPDLDDDPDAEGDESEDSAPGDVPPGYLQPVAYLWTRTVTCPNPSCRATVPLVRQTWLKKKKGDNVALEMVPHPTENRMAFHVRRAADPADFGFDPAGFSQRGNSVCGRCGTTVTSDYVKVEGKAGRMAAQMMATVCVRAGVSGKVYLSPDEHTLPLPDEDAIRARIEALTAETGITPPEEEIFSGDSRAFFTHLYGLTKFRHLFMPRAILVLLTSIKWIHRASDAMLLGEGDPEYFRAQTTYLGLALSRLVGFMSSQSTWLGVDGERVTSAFGRQAIPMIWDFVELAPFNTVFASLQSSISIILDVLAQLPDENPARVYRGSAAFIPLEGASIDAIVSDPPYYDNVPYSDLSDFFYVWLKRCLGTIHSEHLSADLTPKKSEIVASLARYGHDINQARNVYEKMMSDVMKQAYHVLKPKSPMVLVYAHKTTAGWSTFVDALRNNGFEVTEAWPLDTERPGRLRSQNSAALASSFFLVARKREGGRAGDYLGEVQPEMRRIIRERVKFFLEQGITGADLNIAAVGAGLAPYTRFARVELPNGQELSAAAYLDEAQAEVVRVLLGEAAQTDPVTQYYIMGRSYYGEAWVDFDEANTLARATGIELDTGAESLSRGKFGLVEKKGAKVRLRDYAERGEFKGLGLPSPEVRAAPLVDVLHRLLWLVENDNGRISEFLGLALPDRYLLRVAAQALGGRGLASEPTPGAVKDVRSAEQRAIDTLLASWRRIFEEGAML